LPYLRTHFTEQTIAHRLRILRGRGFGHCDYSV
jgi:hypothetical protein